jgi:predicted membrane channel-forming protein YqfA (hemolysin III family)
MPSDLSAARSSPFRVTPFGVFVGAFLLLLGAVVAIAIAQFWAKPLATWISISYSVGAVLCTLAAVAMHPRR